MVWHSIEVRSNKVRDDDLRGWNGRRKLQRLRKLAHVPQAPSPASTERHVKVHWYCDMLPTCLHKKTRVQTSTSGLQSLL